MLNLFAIVKYIYKFDNDINSINMNTQRQLSENKVLSAIRPPLFILIYRGLLPILCLLMLAHDGFSQSLSPVDSKISIVQNSGVVTIELPDTTNVSQIEITLLSTNNDLLFNNSFNFDVTVGLISGMSYSRDNFTVSIGIGQIVLPLVYQSRIRLKNSSGTWGNYYEYISN